MPEWFQALVLGLVQGATEFIPVSSSAHLVLIPNLLGWDRPGVAFDVALHAGTAGAIVAYYRRDLLQMARALLAPSSSADGHAWRRLVGQLALASVPVAVVGLTLRGPLEEAFATPRLAAVMLTVTAVLLLGGEGWRRRRVARAHAADVAPADAVPVDVVRADATQLDDGVRPDDAVTIGFGPDPSDPTGTPLDRLRWGQALLVGLGQAVALIPGLSRSGTTITAGLLAGATRPAATRFAFLLALPAIVGASLVSLPDLAEPGGYGILAILIGVAAAFVAGLAAIAWLTRLVARAGLGGFSIYLVFASALSLLVLPS